MLCSSFLWLLAPITALVEWTCDKQMSVWLLLYSLLPLLVLPFVCSVLCHLAIWTSPLPNEEDKKVVLGLGLLLAIFFFHIYLARVSRLMSKSFDILCISPASTNRNVNKFTKCEHFTASNKCRAVSFGARSSLMFCLIWIGAA